MNSLETFSICFILFTLLIPYLLCKIISVTEISKEESISPKMLGLNELHPMIQCHLVYSRYLRYLDFISFKDVIELLIELSFQSMIPRIKTKTCLQECIDNSNYWTDVSRQLHNKHPSCTKS